MYTYTTPITRALQLLLIEHTQLTNLTSNNILYDLKITFTLSTLPYLILQSILYYGAFSRFTHGKYTPAFHAYQRARAPNNEYTLFIPIFDVLLGSLLFSTRARPWAARFFAVAQGGGIIKLVQEGKDVTPDVVLFTIAILVFVASCVQYRK